MALLKESEKSSLEQSRFLPEITIFLGKHRSGVLFHRHDGQEKVLGQTQSRNAITIRISKRL